MNKSVHLLIVLLGLGSGLGCARAKMQETAASVADAVDELRADVETQQLVRTEMARSGAERLARSEAELGNRDAARVAERQQLPEAAAPLVRHSRAVAEGADPRFAPTIATEVERREAAVDYERHVDELEALAYLLERLAEGDLRDEIQLYLELGAAAAEAARDEWSEAEAQD